MAPPRPSFQGVSPVLLSSSCDVLANNSAIPNSDALTYPFRKAVLIDEVAWTMRLASSTSLNLGALVSSRMQIGQRYLMRDAVPTWVLGTLMTLAQEQVVDTSLTTPMAYSHYRWRFPKPLYVAAGSYLSSVFSRGNDGFGSINVQVSYRGRTVSPGQPVPDVIDVPYAAIFTTTLGNLFEQSNEADLFNPFDVPIQVQRLTGRVLSFVSATSAVLSRSSTPTPNTAGTTPTVLIDDSWGGKMVNDQTGPSDIFDLNRTAWTVDTLMPPKGIYKVRVLDLAASQMLHVGMIGTRGEF